MIFSDLFKPNFDPMLLMKSPLNQFANFLWLKLSGAERAKRAEPHLSWRLSGAIGEKLSKWSRAKRAIEIGEYLFRASKASINSCDNCGVG